MGRKKRSIYGAKFANRAKYSALRNQVATEPIAEDVPEPTLPTLVEEQPKPKKKPKPRKQTIRKRTLRKKTAKKEET